MQSAITHRPPCPILTRVYPDVLLMIWNLCSIPSLVRFRASCRAADELVSEELERRYVREISRFISNIDLYCHLLNKTGSVWSGSAALSAAASGRLPVGDLDLYLNLEARDEMLDFLCNLEGYKHISTQHPFSSGYSGGIEYVMTLLRGQETIDVVFSKTPCSMFPIAHFWSTPVMCFFTGTTVCIPYPLHVELDMGLINPGCIEDLHPSPFIDALVAKYAGRGFDIRDTEEAFAGIRSLPCRGSFSPTCPLTSRFFGDRFCLLSRLNVIGTRCTVPAFTGRFQLYTTLWQRGGEGCGGNCNAQRTLSFAAATVEFDFVLDQRAITV